MSRALAADADDRNRPMADDSADALDETLAPLREVLAPEAFREIVTLYEDTIRATLAAAEAATRRADLAALARAAHDLAGMCGQIGSGRATKLARQVEAACGQEAVLTALALAVQLQPAAEDTLAVLASYLVQPAVR